MTSDLQNFSSVLNCQCIMVCFLSEKERYREGERGGMEKEIGKGMREEGDGDIEV